MPCKTYHRCGFRIEDPGEFPQPKMTPITGTCASVRLDSLIALAFGTSRSSIVHCIEEGLVFVNGKLITSNGYEPKEGDIISVRKKDVLFLMEYPAGRKRTSRCTYSALYLTARRKTRWLNQNYL